MGRGSGEFLWLQFEKLLVETLSSVKNTTQCKKDEVLQ